MLCKRVGVMCAPRTHPYTYMQSQRELCARRARELAGVSAVPYAIAAGERMTAARFLSSAGRLLDAAAVCALPSPAPLSPLSRREEEPEGKRSDGRRPVLEPVAAEVSEIMRRKAMLHFRKSETLLAASCLLAVRLCLLLHLTMELFVYDCAFISSYVFHVHSHFLQLSELQLSRARCVTSSAFHSYILGLLQSLGVIVSMPCRWMTRMVR